MHTVQLLLDEKHAGSFFIQADERRMAEMVISIEGRKLTVLHTETDPEFEGKGLAKTLLDEMTAYARSHDLKVIPKCRFVALQFNRHPEAYADLVAG